MSDQVIQFRGTVYENGYGLIAQKVMRDQDLTPTAKAIYAYLCSFAGVGKDGERTAFPGVSLMKKELGIRTDGAYYKHRKLLIKKGYITIEKQRKEGEKFANNLYYVEAVPIEQEEEPEETALEQEKNHTSKNEVRKNHTSFYGVPQNPSTVKQSTNSNRSLSLTGFSNEEEEYIIRGEFITDVAKYLQENEIDQDTIIEIVNGFNLLELNHISINDVKAQLEFMMNKNEDVYDFGSYFLGGLEKRANQNKAKGVYSFNKSIENQQKKEERAEQRKLYFNWLED